MLKANYIHKPPKLVSSDYPCLLCGNGLVVLFESYGSGVVGALPPWSPTCSTPRRGRWGIETLSAATTKAPVGRF